MTPSEGTGRGPRRRVLVSAAICVPYKGSEPGAGWWWAAAAAERHDVWLLTLAVNREPVDAALAARPELRLRPVYVPQPGYLPGGEHDLGGLRLRYLAWQRAAATVARDLHARVGFDVAHHVTLAADWMPTALASLEGVPFVWGPVGGYTQPAWRLARWLGARWLLEEVGRRGVTGVGRRLVGDRVARRAAVVVAQNHDTARRLERLGVRALVEPNVAVDPAALAEATGEAPLPSTLAPSAAAPRRAVFAGRLVAWKGLRLALDAFARPELSSWRLDIYGDGPEAASVEAAIERLGLTARVGTHGMRPRAEVLGALASADALVLPSTNDSAGWVSAEAAALGCPTVCLDIGGPASLVRRGGGAAVSWRGDVPADLARALVALPRRREPSDRWSVARLPDVVDRWYQAALGAPRTPSGPGAPPAPDVLSRAR